MRVLREVREAACDAKVPLVTVLRRGAVLAYALAHEPFTEWVERELGGYPSGGALPTYRLHPASSFVRFTDPSRDRSRVEPVSWDGQPDAVRRYMDQRAGLREAAGAVELALADRRELTEAWPADLAINHATLGHDIGRGPVRAWKLIPRPAVAGSMEAIRNRLLLFTLELSADGDRDDAGRPDAILVADAFDAVVVHGTRRAGHGRPVPTGDAHRLHGALLAAGLDGSRASEIVHAARAERPSPPSGRPGEQVSRLVVAAVGERAKVYRAQVHSRVTAAIRQYWGASDPTTPTPSPKSTVVTSS